MLKGPSLYNPRRNPENATKRRNLVLSVLKRNFNISDAEYENLTIQQLGISAPNYRTETKYPAFHDLVRLELQENFNERDLRTNGLAIETNLDPILQDALEVAIVKTKNQLINKYGTKLNDL